MFEGIGKAIKDLFKPFEDFKKEPGKEIPFFLLGIGMDAGKGLGWRGALFVWPFVIAFIVAAFLIIRNIFVFFF